MALRVPVSGQQTGEEEVQNILEVARSQHYGGGVFTDPTLAGSDGKVQPQEPLAGIDPVVAAAAGSGLRPRREDLRILPLRVACQQGEHSPVEAHLEALVVRRIEQDRS